MSTFLLLLKYWRIAAVVLLAATCVHFGYKLRSNADAAAEVKVLQGRLDTLQHVAASDALRSVADRNKISQLEKLASETPKNNGACLDGSAARRLRAIR